MDRNNRILDTLCSVWFRYFNDSSGTNTKLDTTHMKEIDQIFRNEAKHIVDMSFDNRLFKEDLTRDDMKAFEDFIAFTLQSRFETHIRCRDLMQRIEQSKLRKQQYEQSNESSKEL